VLCVLQAPRQRLVLMAAAKTAGVTLEVMEGRMQVGSIYIISISCHFYNCCHY
jgi:hypothetical protein